MMGVKARMGAMGKIWKEVDGSESYLENKIKRT